MSRQFPPIYQLLFCLLFLCVWAGCSSSKDDDTKGTSKPLEEDLGGPLSGELKVSYQPWPDTAAEIEQNPGAVTVVLLWNEDNEFNKEEFNEFVRMAKVFRDEKVTFKTTNVNATLNDIEDNKSRIEQVREYVGQFEANFEHLLSVMPEFELLMATGSDRYPAVFVYDKSGTLRHMVTASLDKEDNSPIPIRKDVIPKVKELLKEKAPAVQAKAKESTPDSPEDKPSKTENASAAKSDVELKTLDWDQTQEIVAKNRGKVVVLDLWSNHCLPCMQEFPNLVKLQAEYPDEVKCISFNMDYQGNGKPEENHEFVMTFLKAQNAKLTNVMSNVADEKLYDTLKLGSLPAIYVYGQDGKLAKRFDADSAGDFTYKDDVIPLVNELLAAK